MDMIKVIRNLLEKSNSTQNEHEAEIFALKAQELLIKNNLSILDIQDKTIPVSKEVIELAIIQAQKNTQWWLGHLGSVIAKNFRCTCIIKRESKYGVLYFIGLKEDAEIALETFLFAKESILYFSEKYIVDIVNKYNNMPMSQRPVQYRQWNTVKQLTGARNDYITGYIVGLSDKFKSQIQENNWSLMLIQDKAVIEYVENKKIGKAKNHNIKGDNDYSHYQKGKIDGKNHRQNKGLLT
jgi:hypothetical protein